MLRFALVAVCALSLTACASTQSVAPRIDIVDRPAIGAIAQAELGDTIVEKGKVSTYDGLLLKNEVTWGDGLLLKKFTISPGRLRAKQSDSAYTYYYSDKMTSYDAILGTSPYLAGEFA